MSNDASPKYLISRLFLGPRTATYGRPFGAPNAIWYTTRRYTKLGRWCLGKFPKLFNWVRC